MQPRIDVWEPVGEMKYDFVFFSIKVSQYTFIMAAFKEAKSVAHESMVLDGYTVDYCEVKQGK